MAPMAQTVAGTPLSGVRSTLPRAVRNSSVRRVCVRAVAEADVKRASPLERGGTLKGDAALGKDAAAATKATSTSGTMLAMIDGRFVDDRWVNGTWDLSAFKGADGETDWDEVIDAETARRKMLESTPIASLNEDPVNFDTGMIPWWAWVKRFHLPEAEKANGRAAMVGYFMALVVDQLSGAGLVEQQDSFIGKILLHIVVFGCLFIRDTKDLEKIKGLIDEATFYDKQWNATWEGTERPSETEN